MRDIPFGRPWIEDVDRQAVMDVLNGYILTHGPQCKGFEEDFVALVKGGFATSTSSCMASLHLSYLHFEIGPGDEVLVPAQTHVATAHAVDQVGAKPVFVDCELTTGNMDLDQAESLVTPRTKAISVVHYAGIPVDMDRVTSLAQKHGLKVVEDCALAVGGHWNGKHVGLWGDTGCYSFYPVKHITTGEGGMLISRHQEVIEKIARRRAFNVDRTHNERSIPGYYDVVGPGMNYRMSEMQAALGRVQIGKVPQILARRKANFDTLCAALADAPGSILQPQDARSENSYYCLTFVLESADIDQRTTVIRALTKAGIGTSIYYPQPVPRMTYFREKFGADLAAYPCATTISDTSIALPVGPHLSVDDMAYIGDTLTAILKGKPS